jgi:DNA-binding FadR family transcriptional regulator
VSTGPASSGATRRPKVADVLARRIVDEILERDLPEGEMLPPEAEMLEEYDVSRGTLREALRFLELQGALEMRPGPTGGPMVAAPGTVNLAASITLLLSLARTPFREVVDAAAILDPAMAFLAAKNADGPAVAAMRASLERMAERRRAKELPRFMEEHQRFYELMAQASGNTLFRYFSGALHIVISSPDTGIAYSAAQMKETLRQQTVVVDAIEAGEAQLAWRTSREHKRAWARMLHQQHRAALDRPVKWSSING